MEQNDQTNLIMLDYSKQQTQLESIKSNLSDFCKYFFEPKSKSTLIYDKTTVYILSKEMTKVIDLGKPYVITQMIYHHIRDILVFLTAEGQLYSHYISTKSQYAIKKDCKKDTLFAWVHQLGTYAQFLLAEEKEIRLFKIQEDNSRKGGFKQVKTISGKFACFLYDPISQVLLAFPIGDCRHVYSYFFSEDKIKGNFKGPLVTIDFSNDDHLMKQAQTNKTLGLEGNTHGKDIFFHKNKSQQYCIHILRMNNKPHLIFYFGNQGKLKLYPVGQEIQKEKELMIKLPSDSIPSFNVVDNMLVAHLRNERITFIYDIKGTQIQMLVSPFPLKHKIPAESFNAYSGQFVNKRIIMPNGFIHKWRVNLNVIFHYLKNEQQIFDFFHKRKKAKMVLLKWIREQLYNFKHLSLSKFWKLMFAKYISNLYPEGDIVSLIDLYANVFYTLSTDDLTDKETLLNIILECIRQALEYQMKIPIQLQKLVVELLLDCSKYENLVFLVHNQVIKDSEELASKLLELGVQNDEMMLQTLGLDMANRVCTPAVVLKLVAKTQNIRELKRYLRANYESMEILHPIFVGKYIKCRLLQEQYLQYAKFFLLQKYPSTNPVYLEEAENTIKTIS